MTTLRLSLPSVLPTTPDRSANPQNIVRPIPGTMPSRGDVVSCNFPLDEYPNIPGQKARPCVVLAVLDNPDPLKRALMVVYGTSVTSGYLGPNECLVENADALARAGLHRPTKFNVSRARILPYTREYFRANRAGTTILGSFGDEENVGLTKAHGYQIEKTSRERARQGARTSH